VNQMNWEDIKIDNIINNLFKNAVDLVNQEKQIDLSSILDPLKYLTDIGIKLDNINFDTQEYKELLPIIYSYGFMNELKKETNFFDSIIDEALKCQETRFSQLKKDLISYNLKEPLGKKK